MTWAKTRRRVGLTRDGFADIGAPEPLDLAAVLDWDVETVRGLVRDGTLPSIKVGSRTILNREVALRLIDGQPLDGTPGAADTTVAR